MVLPELLLTTLCISSKTTAELYNTFYDAGRYVNRCVLLSAEGPSSKDGVYSFVAVAIKTHADIKDM
jgi:hypothetical protein